MASKHVSDKENDPKENISGRTRVKIGQPTPERRKKLSALNQIRKSRETGKRPPIQLNFERDLYESVSEEEAQEREMDDIKGIVDDIGDGAYLNDGKTLVDNFQRGKGNEAHNECFTLEWLHESKVYMCYGCNVPFREKPQAGGRETVPPAPRDIVLKRKQIREYYGPDSKELTASKKPTFCYYHISNECILKKNSYEENIKPCISKHEWRKLSSSHKALLENEFGISKPNCKNDH